MGSIQWLIVFLCCGGVSGLQRWLLLPDTVCQGCTQFFHDRVELTSLRFISSDKIILGGRNSLYEINMETEDMISYPDNTKILKENVETCLKEGRKEMDCQNYYKVLLPLSESDIMICGTWGYNPVCDVRSLRKLDFNSRAHIRKGNGFCPADYTVTTSYLKLDDDIGFAGTCINACTDHRITRFNLLPGSLYPTSQTFETRDILFNPQFVYTFAEGEYVYFLFRETAVETTTEKVYSRVARICKNDVGSSSPFSKKDFQSYFKARIYCTSDQAGHTPFDHNEVDAAVYKDGVLYAAFSGPRSLQTGSIVCSYTINSINSVFDGPYLMFNESSNLDYKWIKQPNEQYSCINKKDDNAAFKIVLMANSLTPDTTTLFATKSDTRITAITADMFVYDGDSIIVLYAATDKGIVNRIALAKEQDSKIYHNSYVVGEGNIQDITYGDGYVYAMGKNWVTRIPIKQQCTASDCRSCMEAFFPFCGWCNDVYSSQWSCSTKDQCVLRNWLPPKQKCDPLPGFMTVPKNVTTERGKTAQFQCKPIDEYYTVVWTKNGGPLPQHVGYLTSDSIYVPDVGINDIGSYECSLNNTSGVITHKAYLYVRVPAHFEANGQPRNKTVSAGHQDLVLRCRAIGVPTPTVRWERLNGDLPDGYQVLPNGDLKIIRVMKTDVGGYRCYIRNGVGSEMVSGVAFVDVDQNKTTPEADESYNSSPISITVLTVGIVISTVICLVVGIITRIAYRYRKNFREIISSGRNSDYAHFQGYPGQDEPPYLCPNLGNTWNNTWQSYCHGSSLPGHVPGRSCMTGFPDLNDEEAPPAYNYGDNTHFNTTPVMVKDWYPNSNTIPRGEGEYAEIMTLSPQVRHPPQIPPPVRPPIPPLTPHPPPLLTPPPSSSNQTPSPNSCDSLLANHSSPCTPQYNHTNQTPISSSDYSNRVNLAPTISSVI